MERDPLNPASNYQMNLHQDGLTIVWSIFLSISIICAVFRYDKIALTAHIIFGWIIFIYSFIFILVILAPYGFFVRRSLSGVNYFHAIVGVMLFALVSIQVILGMITSLMRKSGKVDFSKVKIVRKAHQFLGYLMYVVYNISLHIAWYPGKFFIAFVVWDAFWILVWVFTKFYREEMQRKVIDLQTKDFICP